MGTGELVLVLGAILSATAAFIWLAWRIGKGNASSTGAKGKGGNDFDNAAKEDIEHIFNEEFREELRNHGRLYFEKVIGENAMFLKQDLQETTAQLNDYVRSEITRTLQEEFKKYEQSIADAKQIALSSIQKSIATIDQQRQFMQQQMFSLSETQKAQALARFEAEMAGIINHYILRAVGSQVDLSDQLDYIMRELEANKKAILEDIKTGA